MDRLITFICFSMCIVPALTMALFLWAIVSNQFLPLEIFTIGFIYTFLAYFLFDYLLKKRRKEND